MKKVISKLLFLIGLLVACLLLIFISPLKPAAAQELECESSECNIGGVSCGGEVYQKINKGEKCRFTGSINGIISGQEDSLKINGEGCYLRVPFSYCEKSTFEIICDSGDVLFSTEQDAYIELTKECDEVPECGDGIVSDYNGEECDDGNDIDNDGCANDCKRPEACNSVCTEDIGCGGGLSCTSSRCRNEACLDESDCICPDCGDGQIDEEEDCDDGNNEDNDGCSAMCEVEIVEGDYHSPEAGQGLLLIFIAVLIGGVVGTIYYGYRKGWFGNKRIEIEEGE